MGQVRSAIMVSSTLRWLAELVKMSLIAFRCRLYEASDDGGAGGSILRLTGVKDREFESLSLRHISAVFPNKYAICIFQKGGT